MKMEGATNEVEQFLNSRYISASESVWKLLSLPITNRSHAVVKLACHLPDQHSLFYQEGMEEEALVRGQLHTTLTALLETNRLDESARSILYPDFLSIMSTMTTSGPRGNGGLVKLLARFLLFLSTQGLWSITIS